jgi:hypothetical protein
MSITQVYHTWKQKIEQLWPDERVTRQRNMAWLLVGIFLGRSVHISEIASHIPSKAKLNSVIRRIERFLGNGNIRVRPWYEPVIKPILERAARDTGEIRLIIDGSKIGSGHQLLMIALAYRRRSIPVAWTWVRHRKGHSTTGKQQALLSYVRSLLPPGVPVLLVGDSEFGIIDVIRLIEGWGWRYVLRQKGSHLVSPSGEADWKPFRDLVQKPGQTAWCPQVHLTGKFAHLTNVLARWGATEAEPWLLATNLPTYQLAIQAYRRRMWIEELFGDLKRNGFDLESTHLKHFLRLSRLTLAVVLLYVWSLATGSNIIKRGQRHLVDRLSRRDLSIFRIGLRWIQRSITNDLPLSIRLVPI